LGGETVSGVAAVGGLFLGIYFSSKGARNYFRIVIRIAIVTVATALRAENGRRAHDEQYHGNHHVKLADDPSFLKNGIDTPSAGRASQIMATATQIMAIPMQPD
jgi:hypothetical protein